MQEPWSVCLFAVEAPAANSNRCFLVFFSREGPGCYLQWNAKHQCGTPAPARSRIPPEHEGNTTSTQPPPQGQHLRCFPGEWAGLGLMHSKHSAKSPPHNHFFCKEKLAYQQLWSAVHLCSTISVNRTQSAAGSPKLKALPCFFSMFLSRENTQN